jgi:hypothetical protein
MTTHPNTQAEPTEAPNERRQHQRRRQLGPQPVDLGASVRKDHDVSDFETCPVGTMARLRELERMAVPAGVPVQFLCNNTRFKMSFFEDEDGGSYVTCFESFANELDGRWVALVAAEDGSHMKLVAPAAANQAPHHQADIAVLLDMIDTLCNGIAWNIENHPDVMNQSDDEALAAGRALVERYRSSAAEACQSQTANGEKQPDLSAAGEKQDVAGLVADYSQAQIDAMAEALRSQGLTWRQTNFAISLVRNQVSAALALGATK